MKDLLIYTAASGHYQDYSQLWAYSASKAYPEYAVECELISESELMPPHYASCFRLLIGHDEYKYVYVTDVDMMILCEPVPILEFHKLQMEIDKLSYSNSPRTTEPQGSQRMTGLHFATKLWYVRTAEARRKYMHMINNGELGRHKFDDELILMKVCKESGLGIPKARPLVRRHFGIHLGTIRAYSYKRHSRNTLAQQLKMRITIDQAKQWLSYYDDPEFLAIVQHVSKRNRIIKLELQKLYSFCKRWEKSG